MTYTKFEMKKIHLQEIMYVYFGSYRVGIKKAHFSDNCDIYGDIHINKKVKVTKGWLKKRLVEEDRNLVTVNNILVTAPTLEEFVKGINEQMILQHSQKINPEVLSETFEDIYNEYIRVKDIILNWDE
jgi:hypothetical protein